MILLVAATAMELAPAQQALNDCPGVDFLQAGVGMLETAVHLADYLHYHPDVTLIINFGVCGAYLPAQLPLLHICLARQECVADLGICFDDDFALLPADLPSTPVMPSSPAPLANCQQWLSQEGIPFASCDFATVNGVSGSARRGSRLAASHNVCCENMEGAAVARVASSLSLPWLEIRAVSNQVEDRNRAAWKLAEASQKCADIVSRYCRHIKNSF